MMVSNPRTKTHVELLRSPVWFDMFMGSIQTRVVTPAVICEVLPFVGMSEYEWLKQY
jgi:hypothetical protein